MDKRKGWIQLESGGFLSYNEKTREFKEFSPNEHIPPLLEKWGYQQVSSMPKGATSNPWAGAKESKWFQSKDGNTILEFIDETRGFPAVLQTNVYD